VTALSIAVAITALIALASGLFAGADPDITLLGMGFLGLLLAEVTRRAAGISAFLRIFVVIFAVEYVLTGAAYILVRIGWWPAGLAETAAPATLPITVAVFGILVFLVALIPVIRQIMELADPYFAAAGIPEGRDFGIGMRRLSSRRLGATLIVILVVINQLQVAINVRLSFFNRDWFNAIQAKDAAAFWSLLFQVFCFWAAVSVISQLVEYYIEAILRIGWRRWLTERYCGLWLNDGSAYRASLAGHAADNPDQRIADDVRSFVDSTYTYSITLLATVTSLVSFSIILWTIPANFTLPGTTISVPGFPFWVALLYSVVGTWLTHIIGRRLIRLDFEKERFEADFRFTLARLREYGEQVALLRGETAEREILGSRFGAVVANFFAIVSRTLKLLIFTQSYFQANVVIPYLIIAPYFFAGKIALGVMTQTAGAFSRVEAALTFFIARYQSLATYKAVVDRLTTFGAAIREAQALGTRPPRIERQPAAGAALTLRGLSLRLPDGREIVRVPQLSFTPGSATLVSGPSGSGKSTLFRAIAGIWPYGQGAIEIPSGAKLMLLPQRPYMPSGSLKTAVTYPSTPDSFGDSPVAEALCRARLDPLTGELSNDANWGQRLSGGEQQRLAIARALLERPDWLFLDEATAALDEKLEGEIYAMLAETLPNTTIVSIGHRTTLLDLHRHHVALQPGPDGVSIPARIGAAERSAAIIQLGPDS